jgi:hypothetical protein
MRALQMNAMRSKVADFERGCRVEPLLDRNAPLLDVLRRSMRIDAAKLTVVWPNTGVQIQM